MLPAPDDPTLIARTLGGETEAFGGLVDRYMNLVYGLLASRIGRGEQAEDLAQDTFVEAYVNLRKLRQPSSFPGWLHGIARNQLSRWLTRHRRESELLGDPRVGMAEQSPIPGTGQMASAADPTQDCDAMEMREIVWQALAGLPDRSREVLVLYYYNDMSHTSIAGFLGIAPSTVLSHLHNGREKLRAEMMPYVEESLTEQRLTPAFSRKVVAALPLVAMASTESDAVAPELVFGLTLRELTAGVGMIALIGGLLGYVVKGQEVVSPGTPWDQAMRVRLASDAERAGLVRQIGQIRSMPLTRGLDMSSNVRRENGRVWIEGVPDRPVGGGWDTILRGLQVMLQYRGTEASLDELMAYGGDAFNLCHASHWQDVAYLMIPTNPVANIAEVYGYEYECVHNGYGSQKMDRLALGSRQEETRAILEQIWSEIDAGRPVLVGGCNDGSCGDWSVVVGYGRDSFAMSHIGVGDAGRWIPVRGFAGHPDYGDDVEGMWNGRFRGAIRDGFAGGWQVNPAYLLRARVDPPTPEENILAALARAVEVFEAPEWHIGWWGGVDYYFGQGAYERWASDLRDLDFPADLDREQPEGAYDWYSMGNVDVQIDQIVRGRTAAAEFCEAAAQTHPGAAADLRKAAAQYRQEIALARASFAPFIPAHDGNDEPRVAWLSDEESREAGADAVERMLERERFAVSHLRQAIETARSGG